MLYLIALVACTVPQYIDEVEPMRPQRLIVHGNDWCTLAVDASLDCGSSVPVEPLPAGSYGQLVSDGSRVCGLGLTDATCSDGFLIPDAPNGITPGDSGIGITADRDLVTWGGTLFTGLDDLAHVGSYGSQQCATDRFGNSWCDGARLSLPPARAVRGGPDGVCFILENGEVDCGPVMDGVDGAAFDGGMCVIRDTGPVDCQGGVGLAGDWERIACDGATCCVSDGFSAACWTP